MVISLVFVNRYTQQAQSSSFLPEKGLIMQRRTWLGAQGSTLQQNRRISVTPLLGHCPEMSGRPDELRAVKPLLVPFAWFVQRMGKANIKDGEVRMASTGFFKWWLPLWCSSKCDLFARIHHQNRWHLVQTFWYGKHFLLYPKKQKTRGVCFQLDGEGGKPSKPYLRVIHPLYHCTSQVSRLLILSSYRTLHCSVQYAAYMCF